MDKIQGKPYRGPSGLARDSQWLTNEDLVEGKDVTVTVEEVLHYPKGTKLFANKGAETSDRLSLKFVKKERELLLNATIRKVMAKMFGSLTDNWIGKKITLYVTETNSIGGEIVKCVRVRDRGARAATAAEEFLAGEIEGGTKPAGSMIERLGLDAAMERGEFIRAANIAAIKLVERTEDNPQAAAREVDEMVKAAVAELATL